MWNGSIKCCLCKVGGGCGEPSIPASCSPQNCFYLTSVVAIFTTWLFSGFNCDLHVRLRWELEPGVCLSLKGGSLHPWRCLKGLDVALGTTLMLGLRLGWTISEVFSNLTDSVALWWVCCVAGVPACPAAGCMSTVSFGVYIHFCGPAWTKQIRGKPLAKSALLIY